MPGNQPTLYDVAKEAGVSLATASRVLNGSDRSPGAEYRERVHAAAEKLSYTPNLPAQAVAKGTSSTIGLLVSDIDDPYFSRIAAGAIAAAEARNHVVTISVTDRDPQRELALVRALRGQRSRAIILAGSRTTDAGEEAALVAELDAAVGRGTSAVLISQHRLPFPTVVLDSGAGANDLAQALVGRGYRNVAILAGPDDLMTARERVSGFEAGLAAHGLSPKTVVHGGFGRDGGFEIAAGLDLDGIDLVWAVTDVMAIGASAALRSRGISVPGDVALAGFGDIPIAGDLVPSLTTVTLPLVNAGAAAIELIFDGAGDSEVGLDSTVALRDSTPPR